ncbi:MAG: hypothetical protein D6739_10705 [Nitrospirae bacterium]|nr:MAG: hypothetical protein D6739_10705 [Nitrospirota bacterium]
MAERPREQAAVAARIEAVLEAERRARAAVAAAEAEGRALVAAARAQARRILERGEARLTAARERAEGRVAGRVAALEEQARLLAGPVAVDQATRERLAAAARRLAGELTGGAP